jgi:hypothetical protein
MKIIVCSDVPVWSLIGRYQCAIFFFSKCFQELDIATHFNYKFINKSLFEHTVLMVWGSPYCRDFYCKTSKQNLYIHHPSTLDWNSTIHHLYAYTNKTFWTSPAIWEREKLSLVSNCNLMAWQLCSTLLIPKSVIDKSPNYAQLSSSRSGVPKF